MMYLKAETYRVGDCDGGRRKVKKGFEEPCREILFSLESSSKNDVPSSVIRCL